MRIFSYGGGVQSFASLVLAAQGELDGCATFVMANVGDDSEMPATLRHVREVAMPFAQAHGLTLIEVKRHTKRGVVRPSLYRNVLDNPTSIPIPIRNAKGTPSQRRCTTDYKVRTIQAWLRLQGVRKSSPAHVGLGISLDEYLRANSDSRSPWVINWHPLLDRRLTRDDCENIIKSAGLVVPPKSRCWFCPYTRMGDWRTMARDDPALFDRVIDFEQAINTKLANNNRPPAYLTHRGKPINQVVVGQAMMQFDEADDTCESGHCMT
jgi:hypothetical protein